MHHLKRGFTVIELMITVGIVALLVVMAVPAYKDYIVRAKVAECVDNAAVGKLSISEFRQTMGAWPANLMQAGLDPSGDTQYCAAFSDYQPTTGAFTIDIDEDAIGGNVGTLAPVMRPVETLTFNIIWTCTRGSTDPEDLKFLPPSCRGS